MKRTPSDLPSNGIMNTGYSFLMLPNRSQMRAKGRRN